MGEEIIGPSREAAITVLLTRYSVSIKLPSKHYIYSHRLLLL